MATISTPSILEDKEKEVTNPGVTLNLKFSSSEFTGTLQIEAYEVQTRETERSLGLREEEEQ